MMKHREYPIALKQAAVARVAAGESVAEVARDPKLRGRLLYAWRAQLRAGGPAALRGRGRPRKGAVAVAAEGEGGLARVQRLVLANGRYRRGYRYITLQLRHDGLIVNHKRVLRLMREDYLLGLRRQPFVPSTTEARHPWPVVPTWRATCSSALWTSCGSPTSPPLSR
jgi:transposase-like protein